MTRPKFHSSYSPVRPRGISEFECRNCKRTAPSLEFRVPGLGVTGPALAMCRTCRDSGLWWCNFHDQPHPKDKFGRHASGLPDTFPSTCLRGYQEKSWAARGKRLYTCEACTVEKPPFDFPHVVRNYCVCQLCTDTHAGQRWCRGCGWQPLSNFSQGTSAKARNSWRVRCDPCSQADVHSTTVAAILELQGSTRRECAACKSTDDLQVDHDHACCGTQPTTSGRRGSASCGKCVRGYLCRDCNRAEGALTSLAQAEGLLAYIRHWRGPGA